LIKTGSGFIGFGQNGKKCHFWQNWPFLAKTGPDPQNGPQVLIMASALTCAFREKMVPDQFGTDPEIAEIANFANLPFLGFS
jgi:hypothetical protein